MERQIVINDTTTITFSIYTEELKTFNDGSSAIFYNIKIYNNASARTDLLKLLPYMSKIVKLDILADGVVLKNMPELELFKAENYMDQRENYFSTLIIFKEII